MPPRAVQTNVVDSRQPPPIAVAADPCANLELLKAAARLAVDLNLPFVEKLPTARDKTYEMLLVVTPQRLELRVLQGDIQLKGGHPITTDLARVDATSSAGRSLKQPIAKALGLKSRKGLPLVVLDATAGWGEDAWLMAGLGCRVLTVERNKIVATLLRDGLLRAGIDQPDVFQRVFIVQTDARHMLRRIARRHESLETLADLPEQIRGFFEPDVVYLDPMFPGAGDRKTAERKPLRVLRRLVGDNGDAAELWHWAMQVAVKRVVVKRPLKAPALGGPDAKPTVVFKAKGLRYDVYVVGKK